MEQGNATRYKIQVLSAYSCDVLKLTLLSCINNNYFPVNLDMNMKMRCSFGLFPILLIGSGGHYSKEWVDVGHMPSIIYAFLV